MSEPVLPVLEKLKPPRARGLKRLAYIGVGLVCVTLAVAGALIPGVPTTPWVLLASYCFARSSERLDNWLRGAPIFGKLIADWEKYRGIRRPVKLMAVSTVVTVVTLSITLSGLPVFVKWMIGVWACIGICTILFVVPTARPE
ncbi:MAG: YbaN family protein [Gemmataceae bacterium]|nr:YbaN family protein [Gemmataceae bacterium]